MVDREPEWDDENRDRAEAYRDYLEQCCNGCGFHATVTENPDDYHLMFQQRVCPVCKSQDIYNRVLSEQDKQWADQHKGRESEPPPKMQRPSDGRSIGLRPATPDEIERAQREKAGEEAP